jgi:hypothetical protein
MVDDNSHAGQGPVMLDIGGDIGAIVIAASAALAGQEIEARPISGAAKETFDRADNEFHDHGDGHGEHSHHPALVHVGVVGRPANGELHYSAVFGELQDGVYEFYLRPDGPVRLTATVRGGEVSSEAWPD